MYYTIDTEKVIIGFKTIPGILSLQYDKEYGAREL
jgi:hypothetical protein